MPGLNVTGIAYAQELRIAFQNTRFIDEISKSIASNGTYQGSHGTFRDPTYIVKDKEGNVKRYWRSPEDRARQHKYDKYMKILTEGLDFLKPQWYQAREYIQTDKQYSYQAYNFLTLISEAFTDLTCGGGVDIKTGIDSVDNLITDQMHFEDRIYEWIFEASVFGFVGVQVVTDVDAGLLEIQRVLPHFLYPIFPRNKENEPTCICKKVWMKREDISDWDKVTAQDTDEKINLADVKFDGFVFEERHFKGIVEHYLWATHGDQIITRVKLKYYAPDLPDVTLTGLSDFAIKIIPNKVVVGQYVSDWDSIIDINLMFNDRASRAGDLLNQYAEPTMLINDSQATYDPATGKVHYRRPRGGVIMMRPQDRFAPSFLQPGVDTTGTENNLKFLLNMLSTQAQAAAVLINPEESTQIESGVAYKLKLTPTLKKIARRKTQQELSVKGLIFNMLSAINFYHDKQMIRRMLSNKMKLSEDDAVRARCQEAINNIEQGTTFVSLDSFAEVFAKIDVMQDEPYGVFVEDPALANSPEELKYLADEDLFSEIENSRVEMQEYLRMNDIQIEMTPSLPQDIAMALERLGQKSSMSMKRFLMEFDGFTEEQAEEEIQRIMDEEREVMSAGQMPIGASGMTMPNPAAFSQHAMLLDTGQGHTHTVVLDDEGNGISNRAGDGHNHEVQGSIPIFNAGHTHEIKFVGEQENPMQAMPGAEQQALGPGGMSPTNLQSTHTHAGTTPMTPATGLQPSGA